MKLVDDIINGKGGIKDSLLYCCVVRLGIILDLIKEKFPSARIEHEYNDNGCGGVLLVKLLYDDYSICLRLTLEFHRTFRYYIKAIEQV